MMTSASSKTKTGKSKAMWSGGETAHYVEMWIFPLREQGGIHITQILHCIVRVWQPPAGGLIHPSSKRGTDRTRLFRAKVGECSREHS